MNTNTTNKKPAQNVWFISDTHFSHKNITKYSPQRAIAGGFDPSDIEAHDKWLTGVWNSCVGKNDTVYFLGDFSFSLSEDVMKKLLSKLNGRKVWILGNHDKHSKSLEQYFVEIVQTKEVTFKQSVYPFIHDENFRVFMCHYPMLTWDGQRYGVVNVHGHCHGSIDRINDICPELRVDVGIDGKLAQLKPVSLQQLYQHFRKKTHGQCTSQYVKRPHIFRYMMFYAYMLFNKIIKCVRN